MCTLVSSEITFRNLSPLWTCSLQIFLFILARKLQNGTIAFPSEHEQRAIRYQCPRKWSEDGTERLRSRVNGALFNTSCTVIFFIHIRGCFHLRRSIVISSKSHGNRRNDLLFTFVQHFYAKSPSKLAVLTVDKGDSRLRFQQPVIRSWSQAGKPIVACLYVLNQSLTIVD